MIKEQKLKGLGDKIRLCRIDRGLSQTELAHKVGKDQPSINRLERGNVNPSYIYLLEICEGLEVSLADLLNSY